MKKTKPSGLPGLLLLILLITAVILVFGCRTSSNTTSSSTFDSTSIIELKTKLRESDSVANYYANKIREMEAGVVFNDNPPCNDSLLEEIINEVQTNLYLSEMAKDSLTDKLNKLSRAQPNVIDIGADGSMKIRGAISKFNISLKEKSDSISMLRLKIKEIDSLNKKKTIVAATSDESAKKKRKFLTGLWWLWLCTGIVLGCVIWHNLTPVKSLFTKKIKS